jgi:branched-subunit amino acid aminotransferase/4-amino-4-deoxychorismate lyase
MSGTPAASANCSPSVARSSSAAAASASWRPSLPEPRPEAARSSASARAADRVGASPDLTVAGRCEIGTVIELDGVPVDPEQLKALALYNYGHFTSMRVQDGGVRGLTLHLRRLVDDYRALFDAELDPDRVRRLVRHALRDVDRPTVVRVTVFDPQLDLANAGARARPRVLVTHRWASADDAPLPPLRVRSVRYRRDCPLVKHVGLFGMYQFRRAARRDGLDDVMFVDAASHVCEGATWNIGFIQGDEVVWPRAEVLPGVTMRLLQGTHQRRLGCTPDPPPGRETDRRLIRVPGQS